MKTIRKLSFALALVVGVCTSTQAAPIPGTGGGYYGSAWFDSNQGAVVAGAATWAECNARLQEYISHAISVWGWTVVSYTPCHYREPFGQMAQEAHVGIELGAKNPEESGGVVRAITDEIVRARSQYRADEYEAVMSAIYGAGEGR